MNLRFNSWLIQRNNRRRRAEDEQLPPETVPSFSVNPVATGTPHLGQSLSVNTGTASGGGLSYGFQWQKNGVNIVGQTLNALSVTAASPAHGDILRCVVTATNTAGSASANSNGLAVVLAPTVTSPSSISGATTPGATLTGTSAVFSNGGTGTREWFKNGSGTGQSGATYSATVHGDQVFLRTTGTNAAGSVVSDSAVVSVAAVNTHANLPILGTATRKKVAFSNDETSDANTDIMVWACHALGLIDLIWQDQTSSTDANIANQNTTSFNPTLTSTYYNQEIAARAADMVNCSNSGWDMSAVPAIAGTYEGHLVPQDDIANIVRRSNPPASSASLVAAVNANYAAGQPVIFLCGGPLTTLADAWLSIADVGNARADWAAKVVVMFVAGAPVTNEGFYNEWSDSAAARLVFKYFTCVCFPTNYLTLTNVDITGTAGTCDPSPVPLFVGQTIIGANITAATYITATNGSTSFTLSTAVGATITDGTRLINGSFAAVPKPWLLDRLPDSVLRSRMFNKNRPGNTLPAGIDGDCNPLICLLDPTYVTTVTRYTVASDAYFNKDQGAGTVQRRLPLVTADVAGKLYYCTATDAVKATNAWWAVMTTPRLWTKGANLVFTPIATNGGSDDFERTNGALGANWASFGSIAQGTIVNGKLAKATTGYAYSVPVASYTNDQFAQFKMTQTPATNYFASIGVRSQFFSGNDVNGYQLYSLTTGSNLQTGTGAVYTNPHSGLPAFVAGDTWRVAMKGTLLTVWRNNGAESALHVRHSDGFKLVAVSANRTEHTTGKPSLLCSRNAGPTEFGDDWVSGNVT